MSYRNVSVSIQLGANGRRIGGACAPHRGMVFRGAAGTLRRASVTLDTDRPVYVQIRDTTGVHLATPRLIAREDGSVHRIRWARRASANP